MIKEQRHLHSFLICLGNSEAGNGCFSNIPIPIKKKVACLSQYESVREQHNCTHLQVNDTDIIEDIGDGNAVSENALKSDPLNVADLGIRVNKVLAGFFLGTDSLT